MQKQDTNQDSLTSTSIGKPETSETSAPSSAELKYAKVDPAFVSANWALFGGLLSGHFVVFSHPLAYANAILQRILEDRASIWVALDDDTKEIKSLALVSLGIGTEQLPSLYLLYLVSPAGANPTTTYKHFLAAVATYYRPLGVSIMETQVDTPEKKALAARCGASFYEVAAWRI